MFRVSHVRQAQACNDYVLHITFDNGVTKLYDLKPKLIDERFGILRDRGFFKVLLWIAYAKIWKQLKPANFAGFLLF
ncbi:hypothetical protein SRRS_38790 [Sporomusa rhizae]|uniref:hypothetical protein n=1 Tax=Sporomusa rhizae TaxID=357999 RepID=UPI00352A0ABF